MNALHRYLPFVILLPLISCSGAKSLPKPAPTPEEAARRLMEVFKDAVESHDRTLLMSLMDPDYVKAQHDDFLEGNTEQFLNELFSGNDADTDEWRNVRIDELVRIGFVAMGHIDEGGYCELDLGIRLQDGSTVKPPLFIVVRKTTGGEYVAGLRGAVG